MRDEPMPLLACLIPDGRRQRLLLVDAEGGARLPSLAGLRPGWFAMDVADVGPRLRADLGLDATVLRDLGEEGHRRWCEVEVHGGRPAQGRWVPIDELPPLAAEDRRVVDRWRSQRGEPAPRRRPGWEQPGWHRRAVAWIGRQLRDLGLEATGPVRQFKAAWSWSCLLVAPTRSGDVYFKACYDKPPGEVDLILALQPRWAQCLPRLLATDERGWMLMEDFDGAPIEDQPPAVWAAAAARFAQLQLDCAGEADAWAQVGCPDRRVEVLPSLLHDVLADEAVLFAGPQPLTRAEVRRLRRLQPLFAGLCERLAAGPVPVSLHNQDFRAGNLIRIGDDFLFYDWGDTVLSHPFFSVQRMIDFTGRPTGAPGWHWTMRRRGDGLRRAIRDAYLAAWSAVAPRAALREAFVLTRQLNEVYQAVRWHREIRHVELDSPWGAVMPRVTRSSLRNVLEVGAALEGTR